MLPPNGRLMFDLQALADAEIRAALENGGSLSRRPWDEVSGVRTIVLDGIDQIAAAWKPTLSAANIEIELTAVFCHSRPQVSFPPKIYVQGTGRCELADLLIVIDHRRIDGSVSDRRAVLIQAKRNKDGGINLSGSDWTQHELLSTLPVFHFIEQSYDTARPRDLKRVPACGRRSRTAEYGGIELEGTPRTWTSLVPRSIIHPTLVKSLEEPIPLAALLVQMAFGTPACGRKAVQGANDDWSFTVDELLRVTGEIEINANDGTGIIRRNARVSGVIVDTAAYLSTPRGVGAGGGPVKPDEETYWPDGPMSTIHLTLREEERHVEMTRY